MINTDTHIKEIYKATSFINVGTVFIPEEIHSVVYVYENYYQKELEFELMDYDGVDSVIRVRNRHMMRINELRIGYITKPEYTRAVRANKLSELIN